MSRISKESTVASSELLLEVGTVSDRLCLQRTSQFRSHFGYISATAFLGYHI